MTGALRVLASWLRSKSLEVQYARCACLPRVVTIWGKTAVAVWSTDRLARQQPQRHHACVSQIAISASFRRSEGIPLSSGIPRFLILTTPSRKIRRSPTLSGAE